MHSIHRHVSSWRLPALSWVVYDFAYSTFIFLFGVRFFPTWIINDLNRPDWYVGVAQSAAVLVALLLMPFAGVLADQIGKRKPFLISFTLAACLASVTLGLLPSHGSVLPLLIAAAAVSAFGQLAIGQYDPLLADVTTKKMRGKVSGLAVALGFVGIIFGLAVVGGLIVGDGSKQKAFIPAAIIYLVFALPAFIFIRERKRIAETKISAKAVSTQLINLIREHNQHPKAFRFLLGRFLYSDAITTLAVYLTVYMTRLGEFSEQQKNLVVGLGVLAAAIGAVIAGQIVTRAGPKLPIVRILPVFAIALLLSALIGKPWTIWVAGPIGGLALGFIWTADRVFMLSLTPPSMRGQFFALFNLANRVASAVAPLIIWSGSVWLLYEQTHLLSKLGASRVAIAGLAIVALLGWAVIRPIHDPMAPKPAP